MLKALFGKKNNQTKESSLTKEDSPKEKTPETLVSKAEEIPGEPPAAEHLEKAILNNARTDNAETRKSVYQELLFSDLLLALAETEGSEEKNQAKETTQPSNVNVALMTNSQGVHFAVAFTSGQSARRWRAEGGQYVGMRGQDIFKMLEQSPAEVIVINAGSSPFVVLTKSDYKQLALGVVPQNQHSPVQTPSSETEQEPKTENPKENQIQIAFPPDVFTDEQKTAAMEVLTQEENIEACSLGAILPPGASNENGWIRTLFLRLKNVEESQETVQNFCTVVKDKILSNKEIFGELHLEVGAMPDSNFWLAIQTNNVALFDKNPPSPSANA
jgi:SseB protein N-terminal domain